MTQLAERFVGREDELAVIGRALDRLAEGSPASVAFVGEQGIGKSRLLGELQSRADEQGHLVLAGRAAELERDLPFGVVVDALDAYLAAMDPQRVNRLGRELGAELAQIFPSLAELVSEQPTPQHERYRAHRAVSELLERLAATKPVVLVLDDLHWSDPASIDLIAALLRRPPDAPVLLALGLRPRHAPTRLTTALRDAVREDAIEIAELGPLSEKAANSLLGEEVDGAAARALYEESGGNPFYLEQLVRGMRRGGGSSADAEPLAAAVEAIGVPPAVAAALAEELGELSADTRGFLNGAAVAGDPFEPDVAAAAADMPETAGLAALDELLALEIIRETDVPRRFRFRHPLVRRAVYAGAPAGWRLGAHGRVAHTLEERGAPPATRAHHVEHLARPGDEGAIALLRQAGEDAAPRAPASAARWFEATLRLMRRHEGSLPQDSAEAELLESLARSLGAAGRLRESRATLLDMLGRLPAEAVAARVRLTAECAAAEHALGHQRDARARLQAALDDLPDGGSHAAAELLIELAMNGYYGMQFAQMREDGQCALLVARALGDPVLVASAEAVLAGGAAMVGNTAEARQLVEAAAAAVDRLPDAELARRLDVFGQLAWPEFYLERYDAAIAHVERGLAISRATGRTHKLAVVEAQATSMFMRGRLAEAAEIQDDGIEAARLSANRHRLCWGLFNRAWTARLMGDVDVAARLAQESIEVAGDVDDSIVPSMARAVRGVLTIERGDVDRGAAELFAAAGGADLPKIAAPRRALYHEVLVQAELARGRLETAQEFATQAEAVAAGLDLNVPAALAARARAAVELAAGDAGAAAESAATSSNLAEEVGACIEAARSRTVLGRALGEGGDRAGARAALEAAAEALDACGAVRYRDEALRDLRRLGGRFQRAARPAQRDETGALALSGREMEVAELVRDRRTNREIAAELFLSEKTVESHLRNIFAKLGVSSRVDVARALDESQG